MRMDAQQPKPGASHAARPRVVRLVVAWLVIVLAIGLWQGYGAWLLSGGDHAC
jgi:hypothetical protein